MRYSRKHVDWELERLVKITGNKKFFLDWSGCPQRPRLLYGDPYAGNKDISPRLPKKEMCNWIEAFIQGVKYVEDRRKEIY